MKIRFISSNPKKIEEVREILSASNIEVIPIPLKIEELQTEDPRKLVSHKVQEAFKEIGKPVFVEHTGLHIRELNGFPAGLTQIFWDKLGAEKFASIIGNLTDPFLEAKTMIGYCDGLKIHFFEGSISGKVPRIPAGDRSFQWDCVFVPDGYKETFAEMGLTKNSISMRRMALNEFKKFLDKTV